MGVTKYVRTSPVVDEAIRKRQKVMTKLFGEDKTKADLINDLLLQNINSITAKTKDLKNKLKELKQK